MKEQMRRKQYVEVTVSFADDGRMKPLSICLDDGQKYAIDRVTDVRQAAAMRCGGQGDRYTVRLLGQERYMFLEHDPDLTSNRLRWFVEGNT